MIPSFNFYGNIKFVETIKNIITKILGYKVYYISTNRGYTPWFETPTERIGLEKTVNTH